MEEKRFGVAEVGRSVGEVSVGVSLQKTDTQRKKI